MDECEEVFGSAVVSGCEASEVLELVLGIILGVPNHFSRKARRG
jgi:exosortase/archaeosortase